MTETEAAAFLWHGFGPVPASAVEMLEWVVRSWLLECRSWLLECWSWLLECRSGLPTRCGAAKRILLGLAIVDQGTQLRAADQAVR